MQNINITCNNCFPSSVSQNEYWDKLEKERLMKVDRKLNFEDMRYMNDHPMTPVGIV